MTKLSSAHNPAPEMGAAVTTPSRPEFRREAGLMDGVLTEIGRALEVLSGAAQPTRPNPAAKLPRTDDQSLTPEQSRHVAGLMRINHVGEVCAQALYRGQASFCQDAQVRDLLYEAATEEVDHLSWCHDRLRELNSRPSVLNPFWYGASFGLGLLASRAGVGYNLGFMAETERQVEQHLDRHLNELPAQDDRSRVILEQMQEDEAQHRSTAEQWGARKLPLPVRLAMRAMSRVMTTTAYRL